MTLRFAFVTSFFAVSLFVACSDDGANGGGPSGGGSSGTSGSPGSSIADGGADATFGDDGTGPEPVGTLPPAEETTYACAAELHVAVTGDDANDGSPSKPYRSIGKAVPLAKVGDCVKVHAGTYAEPQTIRFAGDGTAAKPIVLLAADGRGTVTIDSTTNTTGPVIEVNRDYVDVDGFVMSLPASSDFNVVVFDGTYADKCDGSVLRNSTLTGGANQLKIYQRTKGVLVEHNELYGAAKITPVSLTGASGLVFRGNYCHDWNSGDNGSAQLAGGSADALFEKNLFQNIASPAGALALGDTCGDTCDNDPQHFAAVNARAINNVFVRVVRPFDVFGCKNCAILANTILDSGRENLIFKIGSTTTNGNERDTAGLRIMNNLVSGRGSMAYVVQIEDKSKVGLFMNYNLFWNGPVGFNFGASHPRGADAQSVIQAPHLVGPSDFRPGPNSPAIAHGVDLSSEVPDDYLGVKRAAGPHDIGAFQH